ISTFLFSSRSRHTRSKRDWSSDVCSSDLWEDPPESEKLSSDETEFAARWKTLDKHVVSTTLAATQLGADRTRLLRELCLADIRKIGRASCSERVQIRWRAV